MSTESAALEAATIRQQCKTLHLPTVAAQCAAGHAIADAVSEDELDAEHIVPDVFDDDLVPAVARAVMDA